MSNIKEICGVDFTLEENILEAVNSEKYCSFYISNKNMKFSLVQLKKEKIGREIKPLGIKNLLKNVGNLYRNSNILKEKYKEKEKITEEYSSFFYALSEGKYFQDDEFPKNVNNNVVNKNNFEILESVDEKLFVKEKEKIINNFIKISEKKLKKWKKS